MLIKWRATLLTRAFFVKMADFWKKKEKCVIKSAVLSEIPVPIFFGIPKSGIYTSLKNFK